MYHTGKFLQVEITVRLLKKAMQRDGNTKFLVDGFPRNFDNVDGWNRVMGEEVCFRFTYIEIQEGKETHCFEHAG